MISKITGWPIGSARHSFALQMGTDFAGPRIKLLSQRQIVERVWIMRDREHALKYPSANALVPGRSPTTEGAK